MIRLLAWAAIGAGWTALCFVFGLFVTFPRDAADEYLEYQAYERSGKEYAVDLEGVSLAWGMTGLAADSLQLYTVKKARKVKGEVVGLPTRTPSLYLEDVRLSAEILPRLLGRWSFLFAASLEGGDLSGRYSRADSTTDLALQLAGLDLANIPVDKDGVLLNLVGGLAAEVDLHVDSEDLKSSSGSARVEFDQLGIAAGSNVRGFGLPEVTFGEAVAAMEVEEGKLRVTEGTFSSDLVTGTLSGDITLAKKLERSRLRLELAFTLPAEMDELAQLVPDMKRARDKEGKYHWIVGGTLASPSMRPGKGSSVSKVRDVASPGGGFEGAIPAIGADDGEGDDAEERKRKREERIKERRERMRKRREDAKAKGGEAGPGDDLGPDHADEEFDRELKDPRPPDIEDEARGRGDGEDGERLEGEDL
jgi:type II secretion system protein N